MVHVEILPVESWAQQVAESLTTRVAANPGMRLCLPTGTTPKPVYAALAHGVLAHAEVLLLDEFGGLEVNDPARCSSMLASDLLNTHAVGALRMPNVDTNDHDTAVTVFAEIIRERPIDLAIVGIGTNGHIGMNEPGAPIDAMAQRSLLAASTANGARRYGAARTPTWGITVGLEGIRAAREVWLVATGEGKADIVARALRESPTVAIPASLLRSHPNCTFWLDTAAAQSLTAAADADEPGDSYASETE